MNNKAIGYIGTGLGLIVGLLGLISLIWVWAGGSESAIDFGLNSLYVSFVAVPVIILLFIVKTIVITPKAMLKALIGAGGVVIIFIISYTMASGEFSFVGYSFEMVEYLKTIPKWVFKWSEAGLNTLYITFVLAVATIIVTEIYGLFK